MLNNRLVSLHNTEDGFQRIHSERRVQQVFNQLQLAIFAGRLTPGELIREAVLARDLGVSQATVREALTKLEPLGLVVRTPHRRTEVKNLTRAELDDRIKVRIHLETLAFLEALKNGWDEQDYVQLEFLARKIFEDPIGDLKFHRYIWDRCGNGTLLETLFQLSACLFGFVSILREAKLQNDKDRIKSHLKLVDALRDGRRDVIEEAIHDHMNSAYCRFREKNYPDFQSLAKENSRRERPIIKLGELVSLSTTNGSLRPA